jgi:hypothetical protein
MAEAERNTVRQTISDAYRKIGALPATTAQNLAILSTWVGQAWIHNYACGDGPNGDVHATSGFLPWHRAFLYFHEKLLQQIKPDFMLPVWDWDNSTDIPEAYEGWVHLQGFTSGGICTLPRDKVLVKIDTCYLQSWLLSATPAQFLGPATAGTPGDAYGGPHQLIHGNLGPFMKNPRYAALDPIFYAHHANMDRFYSAWWNYYKDRPDFPCCKLGWLQDRWYFYDALSNQIVWVQAEEFAEQYLGDCELLGYYYPEPANVPLYDFSSIVSEQVTTAVKLSLDSVLRFLTALQAVMTRDTLLNLARMLIGDVKQVLELFDATVRKLSVTLPVRAVITVKNPAPGKYYGLGLEPPNASATYEPPAIGGFAMFGHTHSDTWTTPVTFCLRKEIFRSLIESVQQGGAKLMYGDLSPDGQKVQNAQPVFAVKEFEIRYPKDLWSRLPK